MSLQISKLILYSRDGAIRELKFRAGELNILTGAPQTGKSALIDIIDYLTGRRECNVADGVIRRYVGWYAVLFQLSEGQIFIARQNPEVGERTNPNIYMSRGTRIAVPPVSALVKNTTVSALEKFLTGAIGISENEHRPVAATRDPLEGELPPRTYLRLAGPERHRQQATALSPSRRGIHQPSDQRYVPLLSWRRRRR